MESSKKNGCPAFTTKCFYFKLRNLITYTNMVHPDLQNSKDNNENCSLFTMVHICIHFWMNKDGSQGMTLENMIELKNLYKCYLYKNISSIRM